MTEAPGSEERSLQPIVEELLSVMDGRQDAGDAERLPPRVLRLAMAVASQPHFQSLVDSYPDLAERLTAARDVVLASFPAAASPEDQTALLTTLGTVGHAKVWLGEPPDLAPAVQLVITDEAGVRVFDRVIDWADLLILAEGTLTVLKASMVAGKTLVKPETIREFLDSVPDAAGRLTALLQELADDAANYDR